MEDKKAKVGIKIVILMGAVIACLIFIISGSKSTPAKIIRGVVSPKNDNYLKKYAETLINYYEPNDNFKLKDYGKTKGRPEIVGSAGIVVNMSSGEILFEKASNEKRKIASLTKIMTAVVALEHKKPEEKIYVSKEAAKVKENSMGISESEVYTLEELLYGLILSSGNDAAYAISEGVAGDEKTFVGWMNIKAGELGLKDTYFADPSGLDDNTYSTPVDLVKLTIYALNSPKFREIVKTYEIELTGNEHKYIYLQNQTNLLTSYPGVQGVKTGYTEDAGLCLVTYAINDGVEVVGVVLNSIERKGDMILMLDHAFAQYGIFVKHHLLD